MPTMLGYGGPRTGYGLQDLNYYGNYFYSPGFGYVWQPYGFANSMAGWSPYSNGAWSFIPGLRIYMGISLSLGMAALSLWLVGFPGWWRWLGVDTRAVILANGITTASRPLRWL